MKKGFTLIELLAVIVVLAIIALIAVPVVLNIINDAKESSLLRSAEFYLDAVEYTIADAFLYHGGLTDGTYPITSSGEICKVNETPCSEENTLKVEVSGDKPTSGYIELTGGVISNVELELGERTIVQDTDGTLIYQTVPTPKSFAEDSWEVIAANVKAGNLSKYNVGDTKTIELTGFGTHTVRIANTSTPSECNNTDFSKTACGFVIEFADIITEYNMNPYDEDLGDGTNIGGWEASDMRGYVNNDILNSFPTELKELIIETKVVSGHGSDDSSNFVTTDKLYLLATAEVWENSSLNLIENDTARYLTRQLDYYKNLGVTTDNYEGAIKNENYWWLRSASSDATDDFYSVKDIGDWSCGDANLTRGLVVAFRL